MGSLIVQQAKNLPANAGDLGSIRRSGRSPGGGNGNPLQYCCLGNPMDGGAWQATIHGVTKSRTRLSDFTFTFTQTTVLAICRAGCLFVLIVFKRTFYGQQLLFMKLVIILIWHDEIQSILNLSCAYSVGYHAKFLHIISFIFTLFCAFPTHLFLSSAFTIL